jgi:hypothetical protein
VLFCLNEEGQTMKTFLTVLGVVIAIGVLATIAFGNPSMLPKHPGYPADQATSPVTGQALTNDPGQANASAAEALTQAAAFEDARSEQHLEPNSDNARLLEKPGAGVLPKVEGPDIKIEPPVKEGTRMK